MHDAFMPIGSEPQQVTVRTRGRCVHCVTVQRLKHNLAGHTTDPDSLPFMMVFMGSQVLQATPHTVGLIALCTGT